MPINECQYYEIIPRSDKRSGGKKISNSGGNGGSASSSSSGSSTYVAVEGLTFLLCIGSLELKSLVGDLISWQVPFSLS